MRKLLSILTCSRTRKAWGEIRRLEVKARNIINQRNPYRILEEI